MGKSGQIGFENLSAKISLPQGWQNKRLRFAAEVNKNPGVLELSQEDEVSFVPMASVGEYGGLNLSQRKPLDEIGTGYTYFSDGDVVVAKITPCFENGKGAIAEGLLNQIAFGTTELHVVTPDASTDQRFLFYLSISHVFRGLGEGSMYGAGGQKRVPERFIKDFWALVPPFDVQELIAIFLDEKTAEIDALVEKKQKLLKLLAEKRAAIITNAVTKGLNPTAPMKYSGIDWLGEVPKHWISETPIKYLTKTVGGMTPSTSDPDFWEGDIPWASPKDMKVSDLYSTQDTITNEAIEATSLNMVAIGAVLIVVRGMILLHTFPVAINRVPLTINQDMKAIIPSSQLSADFLARFLNGVSQHVLSLVETSAHGTKALRTDQWDRLVVPLPPLHEQLDIVEKLDSICGEIDALTMSVEAAVKHLQEYRSAMITAAVTGKIKVA